MLQINNAESFNNIALQIFYKQAAENEVYKTYLTLLKINPATINQVNQIPFLPISFFKTHRVITGKLPPEVVFTSSGTTGDVTSSHLVSDVSIYEETYTSAFELFYGSVSNYAILALLPSYLERTGSSLIYMANDLINKSKNQHSGFYLDEFDLLMEKIKLLESQNQRYILLGVTFALLDFAKHLPEKMQLNSGIIMETGGMKGRRKEMIREDVHAILTEKFGISAIHSEYGMTELLSQAYSFGNGIFKTPPWMKIVITDINDPFEKKEHSKTGIINVIDLANINSCSFITTQDIGKLNNDESFEVLGRYDNSDRRGCNLLIE